jgi:hypothetical protein
MINTSNNGKNVTKLLRTHETQLKKNMVIVIALNTTFNDISVTLSHNVVSITPEWDSNSQY